MGQWLARRLEAFVDNLLWLLFLVVGLSVVVVSWGVLKDLPGPVILVLVLWAIAAGEWAFIGLDYLKRRSSVSQADVEFYPHRRATSDYVRELEGAGRAWAIWNTGSILRDYNVLASHHSNIERLLLPDPHGLALRALAEGALTTLEEVSDKIRVVTRDAQAYGIEVKWWAGLPGNVALITDEWILVEQFIPLVAANYRPSYRVRKSDHPDLYRRLRESYVQMWKQSVEPYGGSDLGPEYLHPKDT
jgi:hypothetical protein